MLERSGDLRGGLRIDSEHPPGRYMPFGGRDDPIEIQGTFGIELAEHH